MPLECAARVLRAAGATYFAWGCFRDFVSRPCAALRKERCDTPYSRLIAKTSLPAALMRAMASRVFSITVAI